VESDRRGDDGRRFIVRADEKLSALVELQAAIIVDLSDPLARDSMSC
jgi:hypothetical protein